MVITRSIPTESLSATCQPAGIGAHPPASGPPPPQATGPPPQATGPTPTPATPTTAAAPWCPSPNTGLSQSDTSISSIGSTGHNPGYQYGNQTGYDSGPMGYPSYSGYAVPVAADRRVGSALPWPSPDYASLVASLPLCTTPQVPLHCARSIFKGMRSQTSIALPSKGVAKRGTGHLNLFFPICYF